MSLNNSDGTGLTWQVLTSKRLGLSRGLPPGKEDLAWVPNSATLISGQKNAVLVDTFLTSEQSQILVDWVAASGKNLTAIYITHGHGDHFFGLVPLLERFPGARAIATRKIVDAMQQQLSPEWLDNFWRSRFPGQIPERLTIAEALQDGEFELEGRKLVTVDAGYTDTVDSTCLFVPSVGLLVGGDVVYNGVHVYLGETNTESRLQWIATLDKLQALRPRAVIAGHKFPENDDDPRIIGETQQYLRDFNRLNDATSTARELYDAMLAIYPDRANPGSLWGGAQRAKELTNAQQ
jgi:glyoxylase-like metal-dependent hydrolase (beta-lactamase superfamily II)